MTTDVTMEDVADGKAALAEDARLWDRRMQALSMRNGGATFAQIANALNVSRATAMRDVDAAFSEVVRVPVDKLVDRQRAILLDITRTNYVMAMDRRPEAREAAQAAQGIIIRCLEHEAKLYGLYAPTRVAVGINEADFGQQARDLLMHVGYGPLAELAGVSKAEMEQALGSAPPPIDADVVDETDGWSNIE